MKPLAALLLFAMAFPAVRSAASELHVTQTGSDSNPGTRTSPLRTIQRAADLAQPGDVITVHQGVYRERVSPPRGGTSDRKRIVYQAARGEKVVITGSELIQNWVKVENDTWKAEMPNSFFGGFNPYSDLIHGDWFDRRGRDHHTGAVYLNGNWLVEAAKLDEVLNANGAAPAWAGSGQYLLNVAWIKPVRPSSDAARIAATAYATKRGTQNAACSEGGDCIGFVTHGDWVRYEGVEFGPRTDELEIRAASESEGGIIELRDGSPDGPLLGSCRVPNTGGWQRWSSSRARITGTSGRRDICLVFREPQTEVAAAGRWFAQVDGAKTTIWAQFPGVDPNRATVEINVRRAVFYPDKSNRDYITVRGFTMRQAGTPWAPPTAEQIGLLGTHWSKGWIIEDNNISHSTCAGISLGKYGDEWDNTSANSAEGYVETINRALKNGWSKENIGHHVVRRNEISYCEQAGIVGSLGAIFSEVYDNTIHDIHVRRLFSGAEMAGIKFHGAIDTTIRNNHIYHTCLGLWLDWMAQGTRVSSNVFHDNGTDLFTEVDHGPFVVDNNLFLSRNAYLTISRGGAFAHNLFAGAINAVAFDSRQTPFHKAHSTEVAGYHDNPRGDDRYYNNLFVGPADLTQYDDAKPPVQMAGNVFLNGAKPCAAEKEPLVNAACDPAIRIEQRGDGLYLVANFDSSWLTSSSRNIVTAALLGRAAIPNLPYEQPDGKPIRIAADLPGKRRSEANPTVGPFEAPRSGALRIRLR